MHHAHDADPLPVTNDTRLPPREVRRLVHGRVQGVSRVAVLRGAGDLHHAIERAVRHFKPARRVAVQHQQPPAVPRADILARVEKDDVAHLEELRGDRRVLVRAHRLQHALQQRRPRHLHVQRTRIRDDRRAIAVVLAVNVGEVVVVRAEDPGQDLAEPLRRHLLAHEVGKVVQRLLRTDRHDVGPRLFFVDVVVPVRDGDVLGDVARVEDVGPCRWHLHAQHVAVDLRGQLHAAEQRGHGFGVDVRRRHADALSNVIGIDVHEPSHEIRVRPLVAAR